MPTLELPRPHVGVLQELGARLLDSRKAGTANESIARDLLAGFFDSCLRAGLDRVLVELAYADGVAAVDHPSYAALVAQLGTIDLDDGGPRNAKPRLLIEQLVTALGLVLVDEPDRTITLDDDVRAAVVAALASVVDVELAVPRIREAIIAQARERVEERYGGAFERIAAQLDDRGMRVIKQPKVPLDAVQAVQLALVETRTAIIDRMSRVAIDRAKEVLARTSEEAAARIDAPITHRLTPRDVAILRACDTRIPKVPAAVVDALLQGLTELARLGWREPEREVRTYSASTTFAIGDLLEHPKFGRGTVLSELAGRIDVEFPDSTITLVHKRVAK